MRTERKLNRIIKMRDSFDMEIFELSGEKFAYLYKKKSVVHLDSGLEELGPFRSYRKAKKHLKSKGASSEKARTIIGIFGKQNKGLDDTEVKE